MPRARGAELSPILSWTTKQDPSGDPRQIRSDEERLIIVRGAASAEAKGFSPSLANSAVLGSKHRTWYWFQDQLISYRTWYWFQDQLISYRAWYWFQNQLIWCRAWYWFQNQLICYRAWHRFQNQYRTW
jgi:hypothetical protein